MNILLFAVFLTVVQTSPPVPRKATDNPANTPHSQASHNKPIAPASTPSPPINVINSISNENSADAVRSKDQPKTVRITDFPPVSISKGWPDYTYWLFSLCLAIVGILQAVLLCKTLKFVRRQTHEMKRQRIVMRRQLSTIQGQLSVMERQTKATEDAATAAKDSAEAASLNAKVLINTERAFIEVCLTRPITDVDDSDPEIQHLASSRRGHRISQPHRTDRKERKQSAIEKCRAGRCGFSPQA